MKLLDKILLATDFSKSSENVVENAIGLAKVFNSEIILVHVLPHIKNEKTNKLLKETVLKKLETINEKMIRNGIKTGTPVLEYGNHFDKIIQTAEEVHANTILIGSGEKLKNDWYQLGTTAEKIVRQSNKPVWVIKNENSLNVRSILCPIDFSSESKRALKNAIILSRWFNAELTVFSVYEVHNLDPPNDRFSWNQENESAFSIYKEEFDLFLKNFDFTDIRLKKKIQKGEPAVEVLKILKKYKTDLLIMGTTGKSGLIRILMGSVTEKVIREVPCSFITLKSEDIISLTFETRMRDLEKHFSRAKQLFKDGFLDESIEEYKVCLRINDMHVPALNGIAQAYEKLGDTRNSKKYMKLANEVLVRIWD